MSVKYLIEHPEWGVYLGNALGLGFWSKIDAVGQEQAVVFDDTRSAAAHIASWDENNNVSDYTLRSVETENDFVTIEEAVKAGAPRWHPDDKGTE